MKVSLLYIIIMVVSALGATIPNDPYFKYQWPLYNDGSYLPACYPSVKAGADMKTTLAWDIEQGDSNVVVAIIDLGCAMNHPEFAGRFWVNKGEIPGNGIDDDKNGYVDDVNGWNFYENNNNLEDIDGHGTAMAGIIGANANNGIGFAGIDWHCKLMILRVGDTLPHSLAIASAIGYATSNGARIINLSLGAQGSQQESPSIKQAISEALNKGVLIVVAAGNNALDSMEFPANMPEVLADWFN
jgi:thermitase